MLFCNTEIFCCNCTYNAVDHVGHCTYNAVDHVGHCTYNAVDHVGHCTYNAADHVGHCTIHMKLTNSVHYSVCYLAYITLCCYQRSGLIISQAQCI